MITAEIVADSINPCGDRLTTFVLEYPRFFHADVMTHRMLSRNGSSSRAMPSMTLLKRILKNMQMPHFWGKNQPGMKARAELSNTRKRLAKIIWMMSGYTACFFSYLLNKIGLHKQHANRITEPFATMRLIVSATDWQNFFMLRNHPDAQPEFEILASIMQKLYNESVPKKLEAGEWHIPFGENINPDKLANILIPDDFDCSSETMIQIIQEGKRKIAVARCARVSYYNYHGKDDYESDLKLYRDLVESKPMHLSPTEHVAQALDKSERVGNFKGWKQMRKFILGENPDDK